MLENANRNSKLRSIFMRRARKSWCWFLSKSKSRRETSKNKNIGSKIGYTFRLSKYVQVDKHCNIFSFKAFLVRSHITWTPDFVQIWPRISTMAKGTGAFVPFRFGGPPFCSFKLKIANQAFRTGVSLYPHWKHWGLTHRVFNTTHPRVT